MQNLRKDAITGLILLAIWVVIKFFMNGHGFFMTLLLIVGLVIFVVGILPKAQHDKVMDFKNKLLGKLKK